MASKKTQRVPTKQPRHSYERDTAAMDSFDRLLQLSKVAVTSPEAVLAVADAIANPATASQPTVSAGEQLAGDVAKGQPAETADGDSSSTLSDSEHTEFKSFSDGGACRMYGPPEGYKNWDHVYESKVLRAPVPEYSRVPQNPSLPQPVGEQRLVTPVDERAEVLATLEPSPFRKAGKHRGEHSGTVMTFSDSDGSPVKPKTKRHTSTRKKAVDAKEALDRRVPAMLYIRTPLKEVYDPRTKAETNSIN
ncbi:hypothetical protein AURDEDRAFT_166194 [Auricularia subglabra TFB-10046 SS5]|nr:hypothetical protein AURDEDRAFT_166194 [Auricularia subglabra TFB-10046 SS5]